MITDGTWMDSIQFYWLRSDGSLTSNVKLSDVLILRYMGDSQLPREEPLRSLLSSREMYSLITRETLFLINNGFSLIIIEQIPIIITHKDCYISVPPPQGTALLREMDRVSDFVTQLASSMQYYDEWELDCLKFLLQYVIDEYKETFRRITKDASRMLLADSTGYKTLFDPCYQIKICLDKYQKLLLNLVHDNQVSRISLRNQEFICKNSPDQPSVHSTASNLQLHIRTNSTSTGAYMGGISYPSTTMLRQNSQSNMSTQADIRIVKKATFEEIDDDLLDNLPVSVERIEKLLETYVLESEMMHIEVMRMLTGFNMRMLIILLRLDRRQNKILTYKVWITFIAMSVKLATLPSAFLGMNLLNPWFCDDNAQVAGPLYVKGSLIPFSVLSSLSSALFAACLASLCLSYIGLQRSIKAASISNIV